MFKKLLGNLPFNPSLIGQVAFYSKRLRAETFVRRLGLTLVALAMMVQTFAVISPPESSLASSSNDIVNGGFSSREDAVGNCRSNTGNFKLILAHYGISCDILAGTTTTTIKSTDHNRQLFSMGRLAYGKAGETPVNVPGVGRLYLRYLWAWDSGAYSSYKALQGTSAHGAKFYILYNCGNLAFIGLPQTPQPPPPPPPPPPPVAGLQCVSLTVKSALIPPAVPNEPVRNFPLTVELEARAAAQNTTITEYIFNYGDGGPPARIRGPTTKHVYNSPGTYTATVQVTNGITTTPIAGACSVPIKVSPNPCPHNANLPVDSPECKPCEESQTNDDKTACVEYRKTASNTTKNLADANGTTAQAGDVIVYHLYTGNKGKVTINDFVIQENISDVLDYADVVDLHGGSLDQNKIVSWPAVDLKANQTIQKDLTVRIKNPIPSTPVSASDPGHFDLVMTNIYGNTVNIQLPSNIVKTAEITTTTLPNTGPGTSLLIGFSIVAIMAYFFFRSRLMAKELSLVRADYVNAGGA